MKMNIRSFSIDDDLWERAMKRAKLLGMPLSIIIRRLLKKWLAGNIDLLQEMTEDEN